MPLYAIIITSIFGGIFAAFVIASGVPATDTPAIVVGVLLLPFYAGCMEAFRRSSNRRRSLRALEEIARNTRKV